MKKFFTKYEQKQEQIGELNIEKLLSTEKLTSETIITVKAIGKVLGWGEELPIEAVIEKITKIRGKNDIEKLEKGGCGVEMNNGQIIKIFVPLTENQIKTNTKQKEGSKNSSGDEKYEPDKYYGIDRIK